MPYLYRVVCDAHLAWDEARGELQRDARAARRAVRNLCLEEVFGERV